ncbi:hypothetical protein JD969_09995 [Planctomycetota bacterium]|nr:hypothetical protein JD969_09995 [Planctomycetota bacterium]
MPDAKLEPLPQLKLKPLKPPAFCLSCKYNIAYLSEFRCPECGRSFDPTDYRTYLDEDPEVLRYNTILLNCTVISFFAFLFPIIGTLINLLLLSITIKVAAKAISDKNYKHKYLAITVPTLIAIFSTRDIFLIIFYL